jgi:hypothetical protein
MIINNDKLGFILGKESSDYLQILIDNYAYPDSNDFWDGNWLNARISIKVGGFSADYKAQLRNVDFVDFNKGLENIYNKLDGFAEFYCLEDYIGIKIKGDGLGHFTADCVAIDNPGIYGHKLEFSIDFDQTEISDLTKMIDLIIETYPIKEIEQMKNK